MRNYFKKFSIMFVMALVFVGVGMIQSGNSANAATVRSQLTAPESGWKRYDDSTSMLVYSGSGWTNYGSYPNYVNNYIHIASQPSDRVKFMFYGNEIRLIATMTVNTSDKCQIKIDGVLYTYSMLSTGSADKILVYEKTGLNFGVHTVEIIPNDSITSNSNKLTLDAIDINDTGYLVPYGEAISLDKSTLNLTEGDLGQLTATTTPSAIGITWTSSDFSVATVDSTGKVTGVKEGTCTITATTANGLTATCTVTVTKKEDPQPTNPNGDANLFIELVDGQIKQYTVSQDEINKFTSWFENRDKDHSLTATYKFTKGTYKDYVVHDQIDWFEVR